MKEKGKLFLVVECQLISIEGKMEMGKKKQRKKRERWIEEKQELDKRDLNRF